MAISAARQRRIGAQLAELVSLELRTLVRRAVADWRMHVEAVPPPNQTPEQLAYFAEFHETQALACIRRALYLPARTRAQIDYWITRYDAANGAGAGVTFLGTCLNIYGANLAGRATLADINNDLTSMENYAANLRAAAPPPLGNGTMSWLQIALTIEAQVEWESDLWSFPLPPGYVEP